MARGNDAKTRGWFAQKHCKFLGSRKHDKTLCSIPCHILAVDFTMDHSILLIVAV